MLSMIKESYMLLTSPLETSTFQDNFVAQPLSNQKQTMLVITVLLSNSPDKKESNNGSEYFGVQKGANFTIIVCLMLLTGLNRNKS